MSLSVRFGQALSERVGEARGVRHRACRSGVPPRLLAAVLAALLASPVLAVAASATTEPAVPAAALSALVRVGSAPTVPPGARPTGTLRPGRSIEIGLSLEPRNPAALAAYAAAVSTPGSPEYHHYITPATFAARFGPTDADVTAVEHAMRSAGLAVGQLSANRLLLDVHGSAAHAEAAFHTGLDGYTLAGGRAGWATTGAPRLPRSVARDVQAVLGLDDLAVPRSELRRAPAVERVTRPAVTLSPDPVVTADPPGAPRACTAALKDALVSGGWTDDDIAHAYGLDGLYARGDLGGGQTIALFELEPFAPADLATFDRCYFGSSHTDQVQTVPVDGFDLVGPGSGESILDVEDLSALAPAAKILVYEAPNTTFGGIDEYNTIVSQDRANIVSTSWGECESALQTGAPGTQQLENYIFEEAAAQGQTVVSAAGDTGSDDCAGTPFSDSVAVQPYLSVDDPASQPYVLGVGGTSLLDDADPPSQSVWNHGTDWGGGGGGVSTTWPVPSWQAASGVPGVATTGGRQVPDVSASADEWRGITVFSAAFASSSGGSTSSASVVPAGWSTIGGTSSAAPQWAAALAEIADSGGACATLTKTAGGSDLGFVSPELYAVASSASSYAQSFSDVTRGNNDVFGLGLGYQARRGFDLASGLGSPIVTDASGDGGLDASLCAVASSSSSGAAPPVVASVTPSSGPTTGGTTVTIAGAHFPAGDVGAVHVSFGTAVASVQSVTSSSVTVTAPQSDLANAAASVAAAGRVDVVVSVASASGSASSLPSSASAYEYVDESTTGATVPTVSGVGPSGGNVAGGDVVTVYGSGFASGAPTVTFGGVAATGVKVVDDDELTAVVPPESGSTACETGAGFYPSSACQVEVVVADANGQSPTTPVLPALSGDVVFNAQGVVAPTPETEVAPAATEYDYAPAPRITSISYDPANSSGDTPVTIEGSGFDLVTFDWVNFGPATSTASEQVRIASITPTAITVYPPPGSGKTGGGASPLAGGVSVQTAGGLSNVYGFSYSGVPTVRSLSVLGGPSTGGTRLTIRGSALADVTSVAFVSEVSAQGYGASTSSEISGESADRLTVVVPADIPGPVDVEPCTTSGCAEPDEKVATFVYYSSGQPSLALVTPTSGPASGGTQVVMFGDNLDGAVGVRFGKVAGTRLESTVDFPDGDPYILAADSAPGTAGSTVKVTVLTHTGSARVLEGGTFRYRPSAPAPPRAVTVAVRGTDATVRWAAPASDGGSPVTSYSVTATASGEAASGGTFPPTARSATLTHLVAGRSYTFNVAASNKTHGRGRFSSTPPHFVSFAANGYRLAAATGSVKGFGSLAGLGGIAGSTGGSTVTAIASTPDGDGYWLATSAGTVYAFGDAQPYSYAHPRSRVVGLAALPSGDGYWEVTASGQVFSFGRAHAYGAPDHGHKLPSPVAGIASTPDGRGYYVATTSGAVYALGDAVAAGSATGRPGGPVVAVTANPDGAGYWLLMSSGAVYGFGTIGFGSPSAAKLDGRAVGLAAAPNGLGYWVATSSGAVYAFGGARYEGSAPPIAGGYAGIANGLIPPA